MREYETMLVVQPEISEEGTQTLLGKLDDTLEKQGATRLICEDLGKRKLAYEIRKFQKGHYYLLQYLDGGGCVPELERIMRIEESILRFMTVQVSDEVTDIEARKADSAEREVEQQKRAADKQAREAEEAKARAEAERQAAAEAAEAAARAASASEAAEAAAEAAEASDAEASDATEGDAAESSTPEAGEAAAPATAETDTGEEETS